MATDINSTSITPSPNSAINQQWVADEALDKQEKLTAEDVSQKYHDYLSQISIEESRGASKDRKARMAEIVARRSLQI